MIKIAHISDIHFRPIQRHVEYKRAFEKLFEELYELKPDIIINTGDFYHLKTAQISPEVIEIMSWAFKGLSKIAPTYSILGNHDCFTGDHELLTKNGWKSLSQIVIDKKDEVATFNSVNNEIEFQLPKNWISKYVDNDLLRITGKEIDALVTPTHEFLYSFSGNKKYKNVYRKSCAHSLPKNCSIPVNGIVTEIKFNNFAALLGLSFAEATFVLRNEKTGACRIQFKFKKSREIDFLKTLLDNLNYKTNFRVQKDGSVVVCLYETIAKEIYQFFAGKKEIPQNIFENDQNFLRSFLIGYLNGDGNNLKNNFWRFCSISKESRDILVTIARLTGCNSHVNNDVVFGNFENSKQQYLGNVNLTNKVHFTNINNIEKIKYSGLVYCVTVDNSNLLVRRNDKIFVAGNCNLTNPDRGNIIKTIHDILNDNNLILLEESQTKLLSVNDINVAIHAYSPTDKKGWMALKPDPNHVNIALFHGSITGCMTDNDWKLQGCEENVNFFKGYDFVLLGDIHKQQYLAYRKDKCGIEKPWIAYPGSLIQQNFGENVEKGYLVWDIKAVDDWNVTWKKLINLAPFVTVPWMGSVKDTITGIEKNHGQFAFLPGTRYRITSSVSIPQIQTNLLSAQLKGNHGASEVIFKTDVESRMDSIKTNGIKISKKGLSNDPETIMKLYKEYIEAHDENYKFTDEQLETVSNIIRTYLAKLHAKHADFDQARNVTWTVKDFKFNNLFGYGENNSINFADLENLVGIFGNNRIGKSSLIGGLMYTLFNTTDRGSLKNAHIINRNKNECSGMVRFSVNGTDYIVERKTIRSKRNFDDSNTVVNFWKIKNEGGLEIKVSQNGDSGPETDAVIRKVIGTSEDFLLTALASQGNLNRFIENKATKRKEILNRFLELDVFDYLFDYAKSDYSTLDNQSQRFSLKEFNKTIERTQKEVEKFESEIKSLQDKIDSLNIKRDELNIWIKTHENSAASVQVAEFENLKKTIEIHEKDLEKLVEDVKSNKQKLKETETQQKLLIKKLDKIDISKINEDQNVMSEIEKNISELKKNFEIQNEKLKTNEKAVYKLTVVPCGDQFPNCHFIKDGHEAKKTIEEQKSIVIKLSKDLENSKKLFEKYAALKISETIKEHNNLSMKKITVDSDIVRLGDKIKHDEEKIDNFKKLIKTTKSKLSASQASIDKLESEEFKKKKTQLKKTQEDLTTLSQTKNDYLLKMGGKKQMLEKAHQEQEENQTLISKLKLYESIQSAFSKNGIPAMILKTQLPAINRELAKILDSLVDFNVTLETDTTSNVMDVYLDDNKSKRLIEMCSGMEKTICSLSLRVALSNLSSLPRPDMLILDESFGALDEEHLQKSIELLSLLRGYFKCILLITHETPIKEVADRVLEIKTDGTESRIEA